MKLPHYFVETEVPLYDTHNFVCKNIRGGGHIIILECHEDDSLKIAELLNKADPDGEEF